MKGQGFVLPSAVLDACCLIDLLASGNAEAILRTSGFTWHLPSAVQGEVRYLRQHDTSRPGQIVTVPADLTGLIASGLLAVCDPATQQELERYTHYAALFRSDGESMCLALAEQRGWVVATDDRRAIRVAQQAGMTVVSCPQLVKAWADSTTPDEPTLAQTLRNIEVLAQFKPNPSMLMYQWWIDRVANCGP